MKRVVVFVALGIALLASPARAQERLAERMLQRLHGRAVPCPDDLRTDGPCAEVSHDFKSLKQTLAMYAESSGGRNIAVSFVGEWTRLGAYRARRWLEGDEIVRIVFDPKRRVVAVQDRFFCLESPPSHAAGDGGVTDPRRIAGPMPRYPKFRKVGHAVVQLHVATDGTVVDACVLYERPVGNGFGRAALSAVRSWSFEPGYVDGRTVDTAVSLDFEWRQGGCSYRPYVRSIR